MSALVTPVFAAAGCGQESWKGTKTLPNRLAMWMVVDEDLRFLSHHDMMRTMERLVIRAGLPLRYTQGFNPHPTLSLVFPRPVGVRSFCDLVVFSLDGHIDTEKLLEAVNLHAPAGIKFIRALELAVSRAPQAIECSYELAVPEDLIEGLELKLELWNKLDTCTVERTKESYNSRRKKRSRTIDLKKLVCELRCESEKLCWRQIPENSLWAKPAELLDWLGVPPQSIAKVTRTHVKYEGI